MRTLRRRRPERAPDRRRLRRQAGREVGPALWDVRRALQARARRAEPGGEPAVAWQSRNPNVYLLSYACVRLMARASAALPCPARGESAIEWQR